MASSQCIVVSTTSAENAVVASQVVRSRPALCDPQTSATHPQEGLSPNSTSKAGTGAISLQKGHMTMTASHSSEHVHRLDSRATHEQHTDCVQQEKVVAMYLHASEAQ